MNRKLFLSFATAACFGVAAPAFSAAPMGDANASKPSADAANASPSAAPSGCVNDIRALAIEMQKDGYWLAGSDYGYGYPLGGYGYGHAYPMMGYAGGGARDYQNARPGYEIRNLIASANILAQNGQQQACEQVLTVTRGIYSQYASDFHGRGSATDGFDWQRKQLASALPVTASTAALRSDQLMDTDVRNLKDEALGSVHDLVISPQTGKIAYLVLARGGIFGIDQKFVPVPWADFKITKAGNLLVLDTSKAVLAGAPLASVADFKTPDRVTQQGAKVDAYWKANLSSKSASN